MNVDAILMTPESSQITSIAYDSAAKILSVRFRSTGTTYHYFDVPPATWEGFQAAESKGRFFGQNIKNVFRYQKQL